MIDLARHPWLPFLHGVRTPSRYVGGEFGQADREPGGEAASLCLAFPDVYEVGMSHLGTQILYDLLAREPDLRVERCFSPWPDLEAELRQRGLPLVSLETFTPLREFDVVGISLQHELCFTNVLQVLDLAGIPLRAADRSDRDPLVLAGGPGALHPEPVAPFFDAVFLGEAEEALAPLLRAAGALRRAGATRREAWRALAAVPGVYVPGLYRGVRDAATGLVVPVPDDAAAPAVVRRVVVPDLDAHPLPRRTVVPWNRAVFDRVSLEVARGCSEGCRFCEAGYTYRPLRDRSPRAMLEGALAAVAACGHDEVSLGALSPADYPALAPLVSALSGALTPRGVTLSVSSLRAYGLSEQVLKDLRAVRAAGLTLAPEAGSPRLRDVINKNVSDEDLLEAARRAFQGGWQRMKLYFMIGLPTETDDDARAIVDLSRRVLRLGRGLGRADVTASVGVFVPRPHTPFQWEGMASPEALAARQAILREEARRAGVTLKYSDGRTGRLECVFARGDRDLADVVEHAYRAGARFDQWTDVAQPALWDAAFAACGVDPERYRRPLSLEGALPWEVADPGVTREFLRRERDRAMEGRPTPPCEKPAGDGRPTAEDWAGARSVVCLKCGAGCDPAALAGTRGAVVAEGATLEAPGAPAVPPPEAFRAWHLRFVRVGRAAFLSQIDLVKHLPRILRRAGMVVRMSGGFHPLPRLTYRDPMPVGYQSAGEWMDADLALPEGEAPDLAALNAASVDGIRFLSARPAAGKRAAPGSPRYAFASPVPPDEAARLLAPLEVVPLQGDDAEDVRRAGCSPDPFREGGFPCVLPWPRERPEGRPHEVLGRALGREFRPGDLVRLYDDPRPPAPPAGEAVAGPAPGTGDGDPLP